MGNTVTDEDYGQLFNGVAEWQIRWRSGNRPYMKYRKTWSSVVIDDNRNCAFHRYKYSDRPAAVYEHCADAKTRDDIAAKHGDDAGLDAMAVWHSAPLADSRTRDEVRVLKLAARNDAAFDAAVGAVEAAAAKAGIRRIAVRCQTKYGEAFRRLIARGYRVRWTDLRMTYENYPERHAAQGVLFSNWEI